jgi:hypothetical protein
MALFDWLLVGHLVGDFLLQPRWMAERKERETLPLVIHCVVYTVVVAIFAQLAGGLSISAVVLVFFSHLFLDRRVFVDFWAHKVTGSGDSNWLKVIYDQTWHLIVLVIATLI